MDASGFEPCKQPPLESLRALVEESKIDVPHSLPPMAAGVFGYLRYDMVRLMAKLPAPNPDAIGIDDAVLVRPTLIVVFDAVKDAMTVVTPVRREGVVTAKAAHARAIERLEAVVDALEKPLPERETPPDSDPLKIATTSNT